MLKHAQLWLSSIAIAALMAGANARPGMRPRTVAAMPDTCPQLRK